MLELKVKTFGSEFIPEQATSGAGCYDLRAREIKKVTKRGYVSFEIKLGIATEIPLGYQGVLSARSSLSKTGYSIPNGHGEIDQDYRGEWMLIIQAEQDGYEADVCPYAVGERCCQFRLVELPKVKMVLTDYLTETKRGAGGFGHTGKN